MDQPRTVGQKELNKKLAFFFVDPKKVSESAIQSDNFFESYRVYRRTDIVLKIIFYNTP